MGLVLFSTFICELGLSVHSLADDTKLGGPVDVLEDVILINGGKKGMR